MPEQFIHTYIQTLYSCRRRSDLGRHLLNLAEEVGHLGIAIRYFYIYQSITLVPPILMQPEPYSQDYKSIHGRH